MPKRKAVQTEAAVIEVAPPVEVQPLETCACCGATKRATAQILDFDSIWQNDAAKRAAMIALVGGHSVTFCGVADAGILLAQLVAQHGGTAYTVKPCPCGYAGDYDLECRCASEDITAWRCTPAYQQAVNADIMVEVKRPEAAGRMPPITGPIGPYSMQAQFENLVANYNATAPVAPNTNAAGEALLRSAMRQLCLDQTTIDRMMQVAATIARADFRAKFIEPVHIAEAIQYRNRWRY